MGESAHGTGYNKVVVPDAFFKAIFAGDKAIAFVTYNHNDNENMQKCAMSVDDLVTISGIDFFSELDDDLDSQIESTSPLNFDNYKFNIMQKLLLILISFITISSNAIVAQDKVLTLNEKIAINNLKDHVMSERKETVANQIKYPLERCDYFEYNINDKNDFINSFDKIFDSKQIEEFQVSKWEYVYYPMFEYYSLEGEGYIGEFDDSGKMNLTHIPLSESEIIYIQGLIDGEKKSLHPILRNYVEPIWLLFAGKYRIRIDLMHDGNIRYSSWKKDAAIVLMR